LEDEELAAYEVRKRNERVFIIHPNYRIAGEDDQTDSETGNQTGSDSDSESD
jgi:hypothetical protein